MRPRVYFTQVVRSQDYIMYDSTNNILLDSRKNFHMGPFVVSAGAVCICQGVTGRIVNDPNFPNLLFLSWDTIEARSRSSRIGSPTSAEYNGLLPTLDASVPVHITLSDPEVTSNSVLSIYCTNCQRMVPPLGHSLRCGLVPGEPPEWVKKAAWLGSAMMDFHVRTSIVFKLRGVNKDYASSIISSDAMSSYYRAAVQNGWVLPMPSLGNTPTYYALAVRASYALSPEFRTAFIARHFDAGVQPGSLGLFDPSFARVLVGAPDLSPPTEYGFVPNPRPLLPAPDSDTDTSYGDSAALSKPSTPLVDLSSPFLPQYTERIPSPYIPELKFVAQPGFIELIEPCETPAYLPPGLRKPVTIFLAGSIEKEHGPGWREPVINAFTRVKCRMYTPRCVDLTHLDEPVEVRFPWEQNAIAASDYVVVNFLPGTSSSVSVLELGMLFGKPGLLVVCHKDFQRYDVIRSACHLRGARLFDTLSDCISSVFHLSLDS